jgi:cytoskeleton protein RodZ
MSVKNHKKEQQPTKLTPVNPGEVLCRARKEKGLAVEEVMLHLGITKHILNALEHDEYDCLPAPMYVKGYIRRYCSILGIPENELLVGFDARMVELGLGQKEPSIRLEGPKKKKPVWLLVIAVVLIALLAIVFWIFLSGFDNDMTDIELMDDTALLTSVTEQVKPQLPSTVTDNSTIVEKLVVTNEPPPLAPGNQVLRINVVQQSWIEILDAQGDILLADLKASGYQGEVSGLVPFEIILGNAPGVELSFNGERVSVPSTGSDNMAKFKIGGTEEG